MLTESTFNALETITESTKSIAKKHLKLSQDYFLLREELKTERRRSGALKAHNNKLKNKIKELQLNQEKN